MAYPTHVAAALTGASVRQLQYWRKGPSALLLPENRREGRALYSFRDLVALRTFVYLREDLPLQRIRRAVQTMREFGNTDHLSEYRLYRSGSSVVWAEDEEHLVDLVEAPGQYRIAALMRDVLESFHNMQGREVVPLLRPRARLQVDPEVRVGFPVVRDTRIPYHLVAGLVADGVAPKDVAHFYPAVGAADARDAASFYELTESLRRPHAQVG
jgi:uncharacterized protein (DUF433 family)